MATYSEERIGQLIDECTNTALQQIIGPFGLSAAMFADRDGGAVDTLHNARKGIMSKELEENYKNRGKYDSVKVHQHKDYKERNAELTRQRKEGNGLDAYTGEEFERNARTDLDHVVSGQEIHDDAARVLAELETEDLANLDKNLQMTNYHTNRSKKTSSIEEYIAKLEVERPARQEEIRKLEGKENLSVEEQKRLDNLRRDEAFDPELARKADRQAREAIRQAERRYYRSAKFAKSQLMASGKEAATNAIRAALGELLVVLVNAVFHEVKEFIRDRKAATENVFVEIQNRLKRVVAKVLEKLSHVKENFQNLAEGFLSGFLSSLVTTLINVFATTAKRFVRAIREGFLSLVKAFRLLLFRPADMSAEDAMKTVIKLLAGVVTTTLGIAAETAVNTFVQGIPVIGQFAAIITPVLMGILTGIATALISYHVDMVFHFAKMREETFNELLQAGAMQKVYIQLLEKTGEGLVAMGTAYEQMLETCAEIMYGLNEIVVEGNRILQEYPLAFATRGQLAGSNEQLSQALDGMRRAKKTIANEIDQIREWAKRQS